MKSKKKIRILCRNPKEFLQEIINNNINLYDIKINKNDLEVIILDSDISKLEKIKYLHKTKILNYYGLSRIKYLLINKRIFLLFVITGIIINVLLSNIVFDIEIDTANKELKKIIENDLKDNNIKKYHFRLSNNLKKQTKEKIMSKEHEKIEWLEIIEQGTKYIIKVQEKKKNIEEEKCYPRNIVSKKTAIITKINSEEGEIVKKVNDLVLPNDIIISGLIYNNDKVVSKRCARGRVLGEVWYKVTVEIPKLIKEENNTNNHSYGISYIFFSNKYNIGNKFKKYKKNQYDIIGSKLIPIKIGICKYKEIKIVSKSRNIEDVEEYALKIAEKKIERQLSNPTIISKKVLKKNVKNSKIIVDVFVSVEEDIVKYQDISAVDIEKINQEEE